MNVIVYGGSGFLGSWIVKKLLDNDLNVTIFDKVINLDLLNKIIDKNKSRLDIIEGDITNFNDVFETSLKGNILINLAGLMTPDCSENPILGNNVNIVGSIHVFESAIRSKNKFVIYTSSGGVFGKSDPITPIPETHYGAFKLAIEGIARAFFLEKKLSTFGLRPFIVYGPGREVGGTAGISLACKALANNENFEIQFCGKAGFVYVEDISDLVFKILKNCPNGANIVNINGISCEVKDIISILNKFNKNCKIVTNKKEIPVVGEIIGNGPENFFPAFKYTCLETGLLKTIDFYKN